MAGIILGCVVKSVLRNFVWWLGSYDTLGFYELCWEICLQDASTRVEFEAESRPWFICYSQ